MKKIFKSEEFNSEAAGGRLRGSILPSATKDKTFGKVFSLESFSKLFVRNQALRGPIAPIRLIGRKNHLSFVPVIQLCCFLFAAFLFTVPALAQTQKQEPLFITAAIDQAQALLSKGQATQAIKTIDDLGAKADGYYRPHLAKCMALTLLGRYEEALTEADRAADLNPGDKVVQYSRAVALMQLGRDSDAAPLLEKVIKADPRFAPAYFYRGIARRTKGMSAEATDDFLKAIKYATPADAWLKPHAKKYLSELPKKGEETPQPDFAQSFPAPASPVSPNKPTGIITAKPSLSSSSGGAISAPAASTPASSVSAPAANPVTTLSKRGPTLQGGAAAPSPATGASGETYQEKLARLYFSGDTAAAIEFVSGYVEENPEELMPRLDLAVLYLKNEDYTAAGSEYAAAAKLAPKDVDVLLSWGLCLEQAGKTDEAIEKYSQAAKLAPDDPEPLLNTGYARINEQKFSAAAETFRKALEAKPDYMLYYYGLMTALVGLDDMRGAADILEQHFGADAIDVDALPKSNDVYYSLTSLVISNPTAAYNLARMLGDYGRTDDASTFFYLFIQTYSGRFPAAEKHAREFLAQHPAPRQ